MDNNHANNDESKPGNSSDENPKPNADQNVTADSENSSLDLSPIAIEPGQDLVDVIGEKPTVETEVLEGDRRAIALARLKVVRAFKRSRLSFREFAKEFNLNPKSSENFGFTSEEKLTRHKIRNWVKRAEISVPALADRRFFNKRLRYVVDETAATIIQALREDSRKGVKAMSTLLDARRNDNHPDVYTPKPGSLRNFMRFLLKHKIPQRLNAASYGGFHKKFGIRVPHGWSYSNECWQIDSAECRIKVVSGTTKEVVRPHVVFVVDAFSSLPMAAEMFDHYPTSVDALVVVKRAMMPKGTDYNWGGQPDELRYDQHGVFHNPGFDGPITMLGIETFPIPVDQSVNNGKVERGFRNFRSMFESQFPIWLRRTRRISEENEKYLSDFASMRREFHAWLLDMQIVIPREDVGETRYYLWQANLKRGYDPFPDDLPGRVHEAFRIHVKATVDDNCCVTYKYHRYTARSMADLQGQTVTLQVEIDSSNPSIKAICNGYDLGELTRTHQGTELAGKVNSRNLESIQKAFNAGKTLNKNIGATKSIYPVQNKVRRGRLSADDHDWTSGDIFTEET